MQIGIRVNRVTRWIEALIDEDMTDAMPPGQGMPASEGGILCPDQALCAVCLDTGDVAGDCDLLRLPGSGSGSEVTVKSKITRWERDHRPQQMTSLFLGIFDSPSRSSSVCWSCLCLIREMDQLEALLEDLFIDFWALVVRRRELKTEPDEAFLADNVRKASDPLFVPSSTSSRNEMISTGSLPEETTRMESSMIKNLDPSAEGSAGETRNVTTEAVPLDYRVSGTNSGEDDESDDSAEEASQTFFCEICVRDFATAGALSRHEARRRCAPPTKLPPPRGKYPCEICGTVLSNTKSFKWHKRRMHGVEPPAAAKREPRRKYACELCDSSFDFKRELHDHERTAHASATRSFICSMCSEKFLTKRNLRSHEEKHEASVCPVCGVEVRGAGSKRRLELHIAVKHENRKPFMCDECGEGFTYNKSLRMHQSKFHGANLKNSDTQCHVCGKIISGGRQYVLFHKFIKHHITDDGLRVFTCERCDKHFLKKADYEKHMLSHAKVKPHPCSVPGCAFGAVEFKSLQSHMKWVHQLIVSGEVAEGQKDGV